MIMPVSSSMRDVERLVVLGSGAERPESEGEHPQMQTREPLSPVKHTDFALPTGSEM